MQSIFTDKAHIPTELELSKALDTTYGIWQDIAAYTLKEYPAARPEWKHSGEKYGWSYRISDRKRVIIYLLPRQHFFKVAMVFGAKATEAVLAASITEHIKTELQAAKPYAEGRGIRVDVEDKTLLGDITTLIDIKLKA